MKFLRRTSKYIWQNYKTKEALLSELKANLAVKQIPSYGNKWIKGIRRMDRDTQPHLITK